MFTSETLSVHTCDNTYLLTVFCRDSGGITDYLHKKCEVASIKHGITITSSRFEKCEIFNRVCFSVADANTLNDIFNAYDGHIVACSDYGILAVDKSEIKLTEPLYVLTAYHK